MTYVTSEVVPQTPHQSPIPLGGLFQTSKDLLASVLELRSRIERAADIVRGPRPMAAKDLVTSEPSHLSQILEEVFGALREAHEEVSRLYNGLGI